MGDTVIAVPALWAVRKALPDARLTLLTGRDSRNPHYVSPLDVLPEDGIIDDYIVYPTWSGLLSRSAALVRLSFQLRLGHFDAVIYMPPRMRSDTQIERDLKFFFVSGINRVLGIEYFRQKKLSYEIPKPTPVVETEADFLLDLLSSEGLLIEGNQPCTDLLLTDVEVANARRVFSQHTTADLTGKKLVAIGPGSKFPSKIWSEDNYFEVVNRLIANADCYPIILGGNEDRVTGERLLERWKTGSNLAGLLSVRGSAAILRDFDLYFGNDTGTMHLAGAVGTACVAIFAAIDYRNRFRPFGNRNTIFRKSVECEGCLTTVCFNDNECLKLVTVDEVYDACVRTFAAA